MTFIRNKENFVCDHCGEEVEGNGYTNHCPKCLWSKHVDIDPGDRASDCGGMMRPERVETRSDEFTVVHKCERCGLEKRNRMSFGDNVEPLLKL